jgi:nonsense-mediated mRNA decay protein 3
MHQNCINIKERPDGLDFYFNNKSHALKFKEFVSTVTPIKFKIFILTFFQDSMLVKD